MNQPTAASSLTDYLEYSRELVAAEIKRILPRDHGSSGGLYKLMADYPLRNGKVLRPAICIAVSRALGGYLQEVLPTAAALELFHNAFLIHDDIEDRSLLRRGSPTLNELYGDPIAVNVGDAMLGLTLEPLLRNTERIGLGRTLEILSLVSGMVRETAEGQMMELDWIRRNAWDVAEREYIRMVFKKTAWYSFIAPVACGCLATGNRPLLAPLIRFASLLGIAFQIQDDALNLETDGGGYGKERAGDLWEGKRTLILIHALSKAAAGEKRSMLEILGRGRPGDGPLKAPGAGKAQDVRCKSEADIGFLLEMIEKHGSLAYARRKARRRALKARCLLESSLEGAGENPHGRFLLDLTEYVVDRLR